MGILVFGSDITNMVTSRSWLCVIAVFFTLCTPALGEPRVVCYYTNWSVYRPGTARFNPQNINPYLCTHLVYAFGGFTKDNALKPFDKYQDIEKGGYAKFTGLKTYNKNLKTLLAIGGWNEGSTRFSPMVASRERRKEFVKNVIKFLRQNRFDGLDLDWEYPAFRDGGKPKDRENYAKLVKELREEFDRESEKTGRPRLLLTMAVPAGIEYIEKGFDVKTLNQYLDWMNLLSYDYHSAFEPAVNHHAPLYPLEEPNEYSVDGELNIDYTIKFYLEKGADPDKLVLGIPTYGRSYTLFNADATEIGAPADGPGEQGDATREKGYLAYYEICESLKPKKTKRNAADSEESEEDSAEEEVEEDVPWSVVYPNRDAMGPVAYKGNQWVGYDDMEIVKKKAEYVADNGLGGIMFWSIDNDDFRGNCHGKPYPLIEAAKEAYIAKLGTTDNSVTEKPKSSVSRRKNRPRTTSTAEPSPAAKLQINKRKNTISTTPAWTVDTPEPPTTPDPGSDFKCTDEGFFQHPRDCKKYFWCLDSGPSNLGIVAHQFTCPSGLFFNKAADSCDFSRNVLCKKPSSTTKAPSTSKPSTKKPTTTTTTSTTTRRPIKLSTKSSALFRTPTTSAPESVEDNLEEEIEIDTADVDAEDPKVIKELIDLIKKVGGVEQLERQLGLSDGHGNVGSNTATTTPSSFNKKLYQKVLERTRGKNKLGNTLSESIQNSRSGPQNAGLEKVRELNSIRKDRPQYTTINRSRPSNTFVEDDDSNEESTVEEPRTQSRSRVEESEGRIGTSARPLQYVNIRRARPTTISTSDTADDTASRYSLFERNGPVVSVSDTPSSVEINNAKRENSLEYVTIRRQRPNTDDSTTLSYQNEKQESLESIERDTSSPTSQPQYMSIVRSRSTTFAPAEETFASPEPTTVLAVQISSLLNSPVSEDPKQVLLDTDELALTTVVEDPPPTTSTTTTSTSTTTETTRSTLASRRTVLKRRGSTTPASKSTTVSQVSSERAYTVVRRKRPLSQSNEISLGLGETNENEITRKIRSTTPDSRELSEGTKSEDNSLSTTRRYRNRLQQTLLDDSIAAAASPASRGHYRPHLNRDELISLTPIDNEDPQVVIQAQSFRPERRYRGRPKTTIGDKVEDSEVSAATVEVRTPSLIPRGRGRFTVSTTTKTVIEDAKAVLISKGRPFTRYNPRPFTRATSEIVDDENAKEAEDEKVVSPRIAPRLPFGRVRPTLSGTTIGIQARKAPFVRLSTTPNTVSDDSHDDDIEEKSDDMSLSESAVEEKEHEEALNTEVENTPKRRIVVKKIRPSYLASNQELESTPFTNEPTPNNASEDEKPRKFKIIRRKPTSTTVTENIVLSSTISDEISSSSPVIPRIRKVIRRKLKPLENEPEAERTERAGIFESATKSPTEEIVNYGEKSRVTGTTPSVRSLTEEIITSLTESNTESYIENANDDVKESVTEEVGTNKDNSTKSEINKTEVLIEGDDKTLNLSENKEPSETGSVDRVETEYNEETTIKSSTPVVSTARSRLPYRPPKRLFTSSTESSAVLTSRSYSRKYNLGAYTSAATVDRTSESSRVRKPLFNSRPFTRKSYTTARTTENVEEDEYDSAEESIEEEPESPLVFVPASNLFTRKPFRTNNEDQEDDINSEGVDEERSEEEGPEQKLLTSRKPFFRPKAVNSNTFRTSTTTTELPKRQIGSSLNRTAIFSRFKPNINDQKKRVQNVPVGYGTSKSDDKTTTVATNTPEVDEKMEDIITTTSSSSKEVETSTNDEDYLVSTDITDPTLSDKVTTFEYTTSNIEDTETTTSEIDIYTDDYLEFLDSTTYPSTVGSNTETQNIEFDAETETVQPSTTDDISTDISKLNNSPTETVQPETTTNVHVPQVSPIIKTQFNKLFSVSRVVEVSSKLDKHRLNKNNESRLVETGTVVQEKKPTVDKIGEVSRFSLIKIFEDEIPIYLTKLGHVYPVDNPPDNPIRIDEARNARALKNFADSGKENLIASESINEAYRHINNPTSSTSMLDLKSNDRIEELPTDDFLTHINDNKQSEIGTNYQPFPPQWQFIPAAYENEKYRQNKAAKSFEIVTPRNQLTDPSTLPLQGLFKTEAPMARKLNENGQQPFVVYSNQKNMANFVKLHVIKPEAGRSIKTYVRGQELNGGSSAEETTVKYPVNISVIPRTTESSTLPTTNVLTTDLSSTKNMEDSTTDSPVYTTLDTSSTLVNTATTTETVAEETTTARVSRISNDALSENAKKRPKLAFPRRSFLKTNVTRVNNLQNIKTNKTNTLKNNNKTTGFNLSKSRFSANRAQNVPVDSKSKKPLPKLASRYTTEIPKVASTTERKLYFKPIRPNLLRAAFVPRKSTSAPQVTKDRRRNFLRRTKSTTAEPKEVPELTESTTPKFTRRQNFQPKLRKNANTAEDRRSDLAGGSRRSEGNGTVSSTTTTTRVPPSRRPFRVSNRRRPLAGTTTTSTGPPTTIVSEESLQDLGEVESAEEPVLTPRQSPPRKTVKVQRRPLTSLKDQKDQNPSATTDEERKRHSKKFSASFKQNQLDEVLRRKTGSQEVVDEKTSSPEVVDRKTGSPEVVDRKTGRPEVVGRKTGSQQVVDRETDSQEVVVRSTIGPLDSEDISAETAVAIAAHQLLSAPVPSTTNYDEETKNTRKQKSQPTTQQYTTETELKKKPSTPITIEQFSQQPHYTTNMVLRLDTPGYNPVLASSAGYSGISSPILGPSTARYLGTSDKYLSVPVEEFGYSTDAYTGGLGQEPAYFTREYLLESPVTRTYDDEYQYLSAETTPQTTKRPRKKTVQRRISTTLRPSTRPHVVAATTTTSTAKPRRTTSKRPFEKVAKQPARTFRPIENYDYYDDGDDKLASKYLEGTKVVVHGAGSIECLDIGNFPYPASCKKFISCARMESGALIGWEYICPKGLSFDPVGGICNWSAGLGCDEK